MNDWLFNVRDDFGAKGDGVTNDSPAFQAAMDAMGPVTSGQARHGTLLVPPGDYWLEDNLNLERAIKLTGVAPGSAWGKSRLLFAPYKGIRVYTAENSPRGGDASYAVIEDIDIVCGHPPDSLISAPEHPVWQPATPYNAGDKILPAADRHTRPGSTWEYYYECVKAGTSGTVEPDWPRVQAIDQSTLWQPETGYYYSSVVHAPNRFDAYFVPAPPNYDGTYAAAPALLGGEIKSGSTVPLDFATVEPGDVFEELNADGQRIIWHCRSTGSMPPRWQPERRYVPGRTVVRSATRGDALFQLFASGTTPLGYFRTGTMEPAGFAAAVPGPDAEHPTMITEAGLDGPLAWGCFLDPSIWRPNNFVDQANRVRPANRYDVAFSLENTLSATTGNAEPVDFATARPGDLVTEVGSDGQTLEWRCHSAGDYLVGDGCTLSPHDANPGPIWACRVAAAIYAQARVTVNRVYLQFALNAGLHVQASGHFLPASNANGFSAYDLKVLQCGCGIVTHGDDCNASTVVHAGITLFDQSDKEVGIAERGFLGNRYYSCQVEACKGPAYLVTSLVNSGGMYGCYSEAGTGPIDIAGTSFTVFGGTYGSGFSKESRGWVIEDRFRIPPFYVANDRGRQEVQTYVGYDDGSQAVLGWRSFEDLSFWLLRWYGGAGERFWSTEWANSPAFRASYLTGDGYKRGPALQGFPALLLGYPDGVEPPVKISVGSDTAALPEITVAEPGDIVFNAKPAPGGYAGWVCVEDEGEKLWKGFGLIER